MMRGSHEQWFSQSHSKQKERSEVRGPRFYDDIKIMKEGMGRGLRRGPRPRSPPRSEAESEYKRTRLVTLARQETVGWVG
jgi:hypothetical protein